jgi:tRNA-splicing ligase RtcB
MIDGNTLLDRGWPEGPMIGAALDVVTEFVKARVPDAHILKVLEDVRRKPDLYDDPEHAAQPLAQVVKAHRKEQRAKKRQKDVRDQVRDTPLEAPIWGEDLIDPEAIQQLRNAMRLPATVGGALMPDAHIGYGIPIGGVVALDNAVAPYMVGVDIACRMMMSIYPAEMGLMLHDRGGREDLKRIMREETRFGLGASFAQSERRQHAVLDDPDWNATPLLHGLKDKAYAQLGTSGTGNHFVDAGLLDIGEAGTEALDLPSGTYLALLTHSGSRGPGATIANHYSKQARQQSDLPKSLQQLAYLDLDSELGQEYWLSMNLAGRFASACHHTMHEAFARRLGETPLTQIENHHNFAWRERWQGRDVIVHRKGATPAHTGVLGIIPGSQGHDSFIVQGKGSVASLNSASHGAGRVMSRTQAFKTIPRQARNRWLEERGVELLAGGMDEAPQAYKDIEEVLAVQDDLIATVARFRPRLVLMADDGKSEG